MTSVQRQSDRRDLWSVFLASVFLTLAGCTSEIASDRTSTATSGHTVPVTVASTLPAAPTPVSTPGTCAAPPGSPPAAAPVFCADPSRMERATVVRVIDGDTFEARIDGRDETVRFFGTDTPERGDACFADASERAAELMGVEVRLLPDVRERDQYSRLLRYVYTPAGQSIDALLIFDGLARAWTRDGDLRLALTALERDARARAAGCLWRPQM